MADDSSIVSGVAGRYATALFELARDSNTLEGVEGDLSSLSKALTESDDLTRLIRSPAIGRDQQAAALASIGQAAGFSTLTNQFLGLLAEKRRLFTLPGIISAFRALAREHRGEVTAQVWAASELTTKQLDDLRAHLKAAMGRDVQIDMEIDESLLGGLVVKVGSRMIDSSLKTKLNNLQIAMKEVG